MIWLGSLGSLITVFYAGCGDALESAGQASETEDEESDDEDTGESDVTDEDGNVSDDERDEEEQSPGTKSENFLASWLSHTAYKGT